MRNRISALVFFGLLTVVVTWPLIIHLNDRIIDRVDGLLITWILNWDIHSLGLGLSGLRTFYNTNIFYPYGQTLAYSDLQLPLAVFAMPFVLISREPLVAFNINFLLGFVFSAWSAYLLVLKITKNHWTALLSGTLFSFSTLHLNYLAHPQLFNIWLVVFSLYFLIQKSYVRYVLFFLLSATTTALYFYFLLVAAGLYWCLFAKTRRAVLGSTVLAALLSSLFLLPYYFVSRQFSYVRPITDVIHFSLKWQELFNVSVLSRLSLFLPPTSPGTPAYFGLMAIGLFAVMLIKTKLLTKVPVFKNKLLWYFLLLAGVGLVFSFGPAFHIFEKTVHVGPLPAIPLPYLIFYYLVPGFSGLRTPSRWILLAFLGLVVAGGIFFNTKLNRATVLILMVLILAEINFPFRYFPVNMARDFPPEQIWLKDNYTGAPIIQFPIYGWWDKPGVEQETLREYYATSHWHPMVNGYSGFSPPEWEKRVLWLQKEFPSDASIDYLSNLGIRLVLVPAVWAGRVSPYKDLKLVGVFPQTYIYIDYDYGGSFNEK